ncbi:acyltransferase [Saxibacter everestensis]|uniref:Acyltransferase n=1 Tax=Saxibacter everestensis TaxID=2909229 RepID=A0ABY8QPD1_9MICO|nr:acyltransferase [Brevibacteriaceae bacterium ZFBP1038]
MYATSEAAAGSAIDSRARQFPPVTDTRDRAVDLVRSASLFVVVLLHAMMVGVSVVDGDLSVGNAIADSGWFVPVSWLIQVMPLFFIVGGFASITSWRRMRARGASWTEYVNGRLQRLTVPAVVMISAVGLGLAIAQAAGMPADLLAEASLRIGQPLWFLAVYIGCSALVPIMSALHFRARRLTLLGLLIGVVGVDALRMGSGLDGFGYLNLAFVWLLIQQLGFVYADGWLEARSRRQLIVGLCASLAVLVVITGTGLYSADMLTNLNPPTVCLVLLGVGQLCLFGLIRPALNRWMANTSRQRAVTLLGDHAMTVYLWHMPVILAIVSVMIATRMPLPEPQSATWWVTRPLWLLTIAIVTFPVAMLLARVEASSGNAQWQSLLPARRLVRGWAPSAAGPLAVVLGIAGICTVLLAGFAPLLWTVVGAALLLASLNIMGGASGITRPGLPRPLG